MKTIPRAVDYNLLYATDDEIRVLRDSLVCYERKLDARRRTALDELASSRDKNTGAVQPRTIELVTIIEKAKATQKVAGKLRDTIRDTCFANRSADANFDAVDNFGMEVADE